MADTLSAAQLKATRITVGDWDADLNSQRFPDQFSDAIIQGFFDDADGDFELMYVYYLRQLVGLSGLLSIDITDDLGRTSQNSAIREFYADLLAFWETRAGIAGGITVTSTVTNTYRLDSAATEEPDYTDGRP